MASTAPDYVFYADVHRGAMDPAAFESSLAEAGARLRYVTGRQAPPERCAEAWKHAWCELADRVGGADRSGLLASETVGSTSVSYAQAAQMGREEGDYAAVLPWLAGTGLLSRVVV